MHGVTASSGSIRRRGARDGMWNIDSLGCRYFVPNRNHSQNHRQTSADAMFSGNVSIDVAPLKRLLDLKPVPAAEENSELHADITRTVVLPWSTHKHSSRCNANVDQGSTLHTHSHIGLASCHHVLGRRHTQLDGTEGGTPCLGSRDRMNTPNG